MIWILGGLLLGACIITIYTVFLDIATAKSEAKKNVPNAVKVGITKMVSNGECTEVYMDAIDDDGNVTYLKFEAGSVSSQLYEGQKLYI